MAIVVAIDGAAGSGKSTLARSLARVLDVAYVNTGVMYRALARAALRDAVEPSDAEDLARVAASLRFALSDDPRMGIEVDGSLPGPELETPEVEAIVSQVARHAAVRSVLVRRQRDLGGEGGVVEGRDIGTVVFPDAPVKLYLTADPERRAQRRAAERRAEADAATISEGLQMRDAKDARTNPFEPAPDAAVIDATDLTIDQVRERALDVIRERLPGAGV
ncbi:MAG: (d)CMP kinase [Actinomycetota bacterium]